MALDKLLVMLVLLVVVLGLLFMVIGVHVYILWRLAQFIRPPERRPFKETDE